MNAWLSVVGLWLTDFMLIVTALLATALALRLLLREPGSRVVLTWGTWLGLALAAVLTMLPGWPRWNIERLMTTPEHEQPAEALTVGELVWLEPIGLADSPVDDSGLIAAIPQNETLVAPALEIIPSADSRWTWLEWFVVGWLVVTALASAWICVGLWQVRRIVGNSEPAPQWIADEHRQVCGEQAATIDVLVSRRLSSAVALGALRPRILLPRETAVEANVKTIRAALAHEAAHIRHGDLWLLALERLLVPLLAAHPLFWWLRRSTRLDQEILADGVAAGEKPVEYAEALVSWAKFAPQSPLGLAALGIWERPSNLTRRVHMILNRKSPISTWFGRVCGMATVVVVLSLVATLSTLSVRPLTAGDDPTLQPGDVSELPASRLEPTALAPGVSPTPSDVLPLLTPEPKAEAIPVLNPPSIELIPTLPRGSTFPRAQSATTQRLGPSINPSSVPIDPPSTAPSGEQVLLEQMKTSLERLGREQDQRIRENMELRQQVDELSRELARLRGKPESDGAPTLRPRIVPGTTIAFPPSEPIVQRPVVNSAARRAFETEARLLELDLADAKLGMEVAEAELAAIQENLAKNPGSLSRAELRKHQFQVDRAKIHMQRIEVRLEAAREAAQAEAGPTLAPGR